MGTPIKNNTEKETISITNYFIALPPSRYILGALIALGIIFGVAFNLPGYGGVELFTKGIVDGMFLLAIPAAMSAVFVKLMIRKTPFRRILATTFAGEVVYALAYLCGFYLYQLDATYAHYAQAIVLFGAALVFVIWYAIARLVFVLKYRSFIFSIMQLFFHLLFLISSPLAFVGSGTVSTVGKFYLSSIVVLVFLGVFFFIINAPMKRRFGLGSTDALSLVIAQWLYKDKNIEKTFASVGQKAKTLLSIHAFERKGGNVLFVAPYVHFGPFGNLGGSEFSDLISAELSKKYNSKAFVFHPTVTHDLNPVSGSELQKVLDACDACLVRAKYGESSVSLNIGRNAECTAEALCFSDSVFISLTRAPQVTEDVDFGLGLAMINEAEKNFSLATVVDQHNSETGEVTSFQPGSEVGYRYLEASKNASSKFKKSRETKGNKLMLGVSERHVQSDCIGNAGIKVAIFSSLPEYVMVVIDSNGVTPEFREKVMAEVKEIGKSHKKEWHVSVLTTDTHQINMVKGVLNPLHDDARVLGEIKIAAQEAFLDMQSAKYFAAKKWFDINVIGGKKSIEMASTVNAVVAVAKVLGPIVLLASLAAIYLVNS